MPVFSLPLDSSTQKVSSRTHSNPRTSKKRKRLSSPRVGFADEVSLADAESASEKPSLAATSTNPLSLTPDEIQQYRVAGLDLNQELPSKSIPDFPHRRVPASHVDEPFQKDDDRAAAELRDSRREGRAPHLRMQHFSVLTTILQRCLLESDIPRAGRAWAMLVRAQHNGRGIDTRSCGYWGIGAELLIRGGERPAQQRKQSKDGCSTSPESMIEESSGDDVAGSGIDEGYQEGLRRWGTASGLEKAKEYYERLILQHPFTRQYPDSVSSLDFWPAMLSCEIYGVQFEQQETLRKIALQDESGDAIMGDISSEEDENLRSNDPDIYFAARQRQEAYQHMRKNDTIWGKRDHCRRIALVAAEKIAARMDELMTHPTYSDSHVLHRLRGMLALYIGDLSVPALFDTEPEQDQDGNDTDITYQDDHDHSGYEKLSERRLLQRNRRAEHERGLAKRVEEWARARKAFEKFQREGSILDGVDDGVRYARADS